MPESLSSSSALSADAISKASVDSSSKQDAIINKITSESRVSSSSTLLVDDASETSADSSSKQGPIINKPTPESRVSSPSTVSVDVVPKASADASSKWRLVADKISRARAKLAEIASKAEIASRPVEVSWGKWDPVVYWTADRGHEYWIVTQPQDGYDFPQYLKDADLGPYQLGAVFSRPNDLNSIISAPKTRPYKYGTAANGPGTCIDTRDSSFASHPRRVFRFKELEQHWIGTRYDHLEHMIPHQSIREILHQRDYWILTGLKFAEGLEVIDGDNHRKFDGRVIFSYRMHKARINNLYGWSRVNLWDPNSHSSLRPVEPILVLI